MVAAELYSLSSGKAFGISLREKRENPRGACGEQEGMPQVHSKVAFFLLTTSHCRLFEYERHLLLRLMKAKHSPKKISSVRV